MTSVAKRTNVNSVSVPMGMIHHIPQSSGLIPDQSMLPQSGQVPEATRDLWYICTMTCHKSV